MPIVDGSSIQDFDPVPADTYNCRLDKYENKKASDQSDYVSLTFVIEDGEFANRKLFTNHSLKANSLWRFKKTAVALGADAELFVGKFNTDEILDDLIGNPCRVKASLQGPEAGEFAGRQQVDDIIAPAYALP